MKKITLFALMAMLVLLAGCKKESKNDPQPEAKNQIVEALDYCKVFYHADSTAVCDQLVSDGWVLTKNDSYEFFTKRNDNNIRYKLVFYSENGVVNKLMMRLYDDNGGGELGELLNASAFKECMVYVGQEYVYEGETLYFDNLSDILGGERITDYARALDNIFDVYNGGVIYAQWTNSSNTLFLEISKWFDEDENQSLVQIKFFQL